MNKISSNKTIKVDEIQPYRNIYKEELVRLGVIDNSLFHAIMVGYSDRYLKSTIDKRIETVKMIRECIGNSITKKQWQEIQENSPVITSKNFLKLIHILQQRNFDIIHSIDNKKLCKILLELLISSRILNDIALNKPGIEQISELVSVTLKVILRDMETKRIDFFTDNMIKFVNDIWIEARNNSFSDFKGGVISYSEPVGEEIIPFVSDVLNRDIYLFRDGKLKQNSSNYKYRKSIVIEQISDNQFTAIGKRLYSSDIEWSFEPDSNFIYKINPVEREERSPMTIGRKHFEFEVPRIRSKRKDLPSINTGNDDNDNNKIETEDEEDENQNVNNFDEHEYDKNNNQSQSQVENKDNDDNKDDDNKDDDGELDNCKKNDEN